MIAYAATMAASAAACPIWGYALARLDDRYNLSDRSGWVAIAVASLLVGAIVATISTAVSAL